MEFNKIYMIMMACANAVILGNSRKEVVHTVKKLIASSRNMGLMFNEEKTKYMLTHAY